MLRGDALANAAHVALRLCNSDARFQSGDYAQKMAATIRDLLFGERERDPDLVVAVGKRKSWRHYAHYRVALFIQADGAPDDSAVAAETAHPQPVTEDGHLGAAGSIFLGRECATEHGIHLQHIKNVRGVCLAVNANRFARTCEAEAAIPDRGHA